MLFCGRHDLFIVVSVTKFNSTVCKVLSTSYSFSGLWTCYVSTSLPSATLGHLTMDAQIKVISLII